MTFVADKRDSIVQRLVTKQTRVLVIAFLAPVFLLLVATSPPQVRAAESVGIIACDEDAVDSTLYPNATVLRLECDLTGSGSFSDALTIVDRTERSDTEMAWSDPERLDDSTWILDTGADNSAEFVLDIQPQQGQLVARLYDTAEVPTIRYTLEDGDFSMSSPSLPAVTVTARDGWWVDGKRINFNIDIAVDGQVRAGFTPPEDTRSTDAEIDYTIQVRDFDNDGMPDQDWRTVHHPNEDESSTAFRSYLMVNVADNEPPLVPVFPWPYLGPLTYGYLTNAAHSTSQPPIQMDWTEGAIVAVGEMVSSRGNDAQWFLYTSEALQSGSINQPNFEAPFAWYDLARDGDGQAELAVRFGYYPAADPDFMSGRVNSPANFIRYSWDQDNNGHWDYKLGFLGNHSVESVVAAGDLNLTMLPYDDIPGWVVDREWAVVTFAAAEEVNATGEGIYDWDPSSEMEDAYFRGQSSDIVDESMRIGHNFGELHPGFRGEYQFQHRDVARLYVSPVDRQLHLYHAAMGVWNKLSGGKVNYADRDGDGYFDEWRQVHGDGSVEQLSLVAGHLLYSGSAKVILRGLPEAAPLLETAPPQTHDEWMALGDQIASIDEESSPNSIRQMIDQFEGDRWVIIGASASGMRETAAGYRFVLDLQPKFHMGRTVIDGVSGPGRYVVDFDSTTLRFSARPSSPPAPKVASILVASTQAALLPGDVQVVVMNEGLEDISTVPLRLFAVSSDGREQTIGEENIDLPAEEEVRVSFTWSPPASGDWKIVAQLPSWTGADISAQATVASIADPPSPAWYSVIRGGWPLASSASYLVLLLGVVGLVASASVLVVGRRAV